MKQRCDWAKNHELETQYHDQEWGVPIFDDKTLFEMLSLEGMQSGLSWITILKKRKGYQDAFDNFEVKKVASYSQNKIDILILNKNIIRHKLKINSIINNAQKVLEIQEEYGSFSQYIWSFVNNEPIKNTWNMPQDIPSQTEISQIMSKALKKKGFKFLGPTTCYAFMQAVGMVNDHLAPCFRYEEV